MTRTGRILIVTLGLVAAGAVFGALAGALALAVGLTFTDGIATAAKPVILRIPAIMGAVLGAAALPLAAWLFLRRVPLGRAVAGCVLGTVVGGAAAWALQIGGFDVIYYSLAGAFAGFLLASLIMWRQSRAAA